MNAAELAAYIDARIEANWKAANVTPAPLADDAEFLRRLYLDLSGRIPRVADARAFLTDKSANKRKQLVEKLLSTPQYVDHFTNTWRDLLIPQRNDLRSSAYANNFERWLIDKVRKNVGYDEMVRELLTAPVNGFAGRGRPYNPSMAAAAAFYQANELKPENMASATSRIFLGVRLECAQCHDHPFADWTRDQFWQYTAFFANIRRPVRRLNRQQRQQPVSNVAVNLPVMKIPGTNREVNARFLDGKVPRWETPRDPREVLADWMTSPNNPYFARTAVNRLWGHFFGYGLIDPVDDEPTKENPISHPELLKELTRQFIAHKYDVKYLIRAITLSKTYQRSSAKTHPSQKEQRLFARMAVRGMTAEQLFESLAQATGYRDPANARVQRVGFNPNSPRSVFLSKFAGIERPTDAHTSILQALALMNGQFIADATSLERSKTLTAVAEAPFFTTEERIRTLYLAVLTRYPRQDELQRLARYVNEGGPRQNERAALADVFWALLNSSEFILNH